MKLACVVQRYGAEVTGGAEAHCRAIAERLAVSHDVSILTSCAKEYLTWRNAYPAGESRLGALKVLRFQSTGHGTCTGSPTSVTMSSGGVPLPNNSTSGFARMARACQACWTTCAPTAPTTT